MNYIDPNNPNSGRVLSNPAALQDPWAGTPFAGAVYAPPPPGMRPLFRSYRLPDGSLVSEYEMRKYRDANQSPKFIPYGDFVAGKRAAAPSSGGLSRSNFLSALSRMSGRSYQAPTNYNGIPLR
jgi:hypothetical protein